MKRNWTLFMLFMGMITLSYAQTGTISPNCTEINAAVEADGYARIAVDEFVTNAADAATVEVTIQLPWGEVIYDDILSSTDQVVLNACPYLRYALKMNVRNLAGSCWSELTFKQSNGPVITPRTKDVYCFDPLVEGGHINDEPPSATIPCVDELDAKYVADWIIPYECADPFTASNDTAKVILREYEAFDKAGHRTSVFDTITVFNLPYADVFLPNTYCVEKDTVYCGEGNPGPFMLYPERCDPATFGANQDDDPDLCDTLFFLVYDTTAQRYVRNPILDDTKCGLKTHLDYWDFGSDGCAQTGKYTLEIKQLCVPPRQQFCAASEDPALNAFVELSPGHLTCEFWVVDLDTVPPVVDCQDDYLGLSIVYANSHDCGAVAYVPPVKVYDDWAGVKQVKATIEDIGTTILSWNAADGVFESHQTFELGYRTLPYKVIYEAYDSCHNLGIDSCYIKVEDNTRPVAIADKGVTVGLSDKKVWVDASTFDEGSYDNCDINLLLARRSDWYEACIDLCDDIDDCWVGEHHDTIWQAFLDDDKKANPVEAHYAKMLDWFCNDNLACGDVLYNAWQYDLMKYATLYCIEHPYEVDEHHFKKQIKEAIKDPEFASKWKNASNLFIGSAGSSPVNDAYYLSMDGVATSLFSGMSVNGAASDVENQTIYISTSGRTGSSGEELWAMPYGGSQPVYIAELKTSGGTVLDIDGLAYANEILYGVESDGDLYSIDVSTGICTFLKEIGEEINGIDADAISGKIYAADDDSRTIVELDPAKNFTSKTIAPYPNGETDIDGVAAGHNQVFLVLDEPGRIYLYDLNQDTYIDFADSPFLLVDFESAAAAYVPMLEDLVDEWSQIGGGWSDAVPFSCEDACGWITVEILAMDYWCNWSTAWTKVFVEDKTPLNVVKDVVQDEVITCKAYKDKQYSLEGEEHPVNLEYVVDLAKAGSADALSVLDDVFGGYEKAWVDSYGNYVDIDGNRIDTDIPFYDSTCRCTSDYEEVRVYDEHLGYQWVDSLVTDCFYEPDTANFCNGIVAVNCAQNVYCEQDVWCEIDHCGQGYIYRKWKIWQSCPDTAYTNHGLDSLMEKVDTIYRHQVIQVGNECKLSKYMFDVPGDTEVISCNIEYDASGNVVGDAGPENTGYATYKFDDDCRIVGIGHEDKVFKIVGGEEACYKIIRTWYFTDWCQGVSEQGNWWTDREKVVASCEQKIIVVDTVAPTCIITGPVDNGGMMEIGACDIDLDFSVSADDACGLNSYYWELKNITDDKDHYTHDYGTGSLSGEAADSFALSSEDLGPGTYKLKVQIQDECVNESYCEYVFTLKSGKKPTPVCITSITAVLTPWDSDNDGEVDSAHALIWANEYDQSSQLACEDDSLEFRIDLLDNDGDDTYEDDTDYLELGCEHVGTKMVRMWVISHPSGTADYCDALLVVQSDFSGCETTSGTRTVVAGEEMLKNTMNTKSNVLGSGDFVGDFGANSNWQESDFTLEQNAPNPFQYETAVGFTLPEAMEAQLTIYDLNGRVLRSFDGTYQKGYNQVQFRKADLNATGVLYYQLRTADFTATRKMLVIE